MGKLDGLTKSWRVRAIGAVALAGLAVAGVLSVQSCAGKPPPQKVADSPELVEKGRYLAVASDCVACHTREGGEEFAGGFVLDTPFGKIVAPNITPDKAHGIGDWSRDDFHRAMTHGVAKGGANLYPAFPYPAYRNMPTEDIDALWAYMKTVPAVAYDPPDTKLGFPYNIRLMVKGWNLLFMGRQAHEADPKRDAVWNRGAYLVNGPGHCASCHTPKGPLGGDKVGAYMEGGVLEHWFASDLTGNKKTGLGEWTEADIVEFLQNGMNSKSMAYGTMVDVVAHSTSKMTPEDLNAIAVYLKSLPAGPTLTVKPHATTPRGAEVYAANCASCHGSDGVGTPYLAPPLAMNPNINAHEPASVMHIILTGHPGFNQTDPMPAYAAKLNDADIAAVANYIRNTWGNAARPVTAREVGHMRRDVKAAAFAPQPAAAGPVLPSPPVDPTAPPSAPGS